MRFVLFCLIALTFIFSSYSFAQETENLSEYQETTKFDEFGNVSEAVYAPKLKNFLDVKNKDDSLEGVVVLYNSYNHNLFKQTDIFRRKIIGKYFNYLTKCFGSRIDYVEGGFREKMTTELWLRKRGGKEIEISDSGYVPPENLHLKLELLKTENYFINQAKLVKDVEVDSNDEFLDQRNTDFFTNLADVLKQDLSWRSVLIYYADKSDFDIEVIENTIVKSLEKEKIDLSKVKIIYGGYNLNPQIESWIVPKNGIEPEAMPDEKLKEN